MENRVLGQKIAGLRKSKKITSEKLAYMCSVYPGHIRQIESGVRLPSLKLFVDICNALQVSPDSVDIEDCVIPALFASTYWLRFFLTHNSLIRFTTLFPTN